MAFKNIDYVMDQSKIDSIITHLRDAQEEAREFIINLEPDERRSMPMLGQKSYGFTKLAHGYAEEHPELLPTFMKPVEMTNDMTFTSQLRQVMDILIPLFEGIQDTFMAVGAESFLSARIFYKSVKNAAEVGIPGTDVIAKELGITFKRSPSKEEETTQEKTKK